ncbi:MAG TPA: 5-formyltetrahydrofolate cyclo-ligase [Thermohalobaculum sp.]|nr:5-formyltetrahydrofolate cyclo-ligase [Thermohalobaculum sp.]
MTDDLAHAKAALRRASFAARRAARAADDGSAAEAAAEHFRALRLHTGAAVISGYRPIRTELDPTPLMDSLISAGHRLCVPVIEGRGLPLRFREWTTRSPMVEGPFGAFVPEEGDWLEPELLIAPLLAFDRAGRRLGYGGGFYDRTLHRLRQRRRTLAVGFGYAAQEVPEVPADATDQTLNAIVTEAGPIRPAGAGAA